MDILTTLRYKNVIQMVEKADKTIEVMTGEIKQFQEARARSKSGKIENKLIYELKTATKNKPSAKPTSF